MTRRKRVRLDHARQRKAQSIGFMVLRVPTQNLMLFLLSLGIFESCLGFLVKHPTFAHGRYTYKRPSIPIQNLYTEFDNHGPTGNSWPINSTTATLRAPMPAKVAKARTSASKSRASTTQTDPRVSKPKYNLQLLLIDHYDSFTYNLYDMLAQLCEKPPIVLAKDAFEDWADVVNIYGPNTIDGVILSPGPGTPTHPEDIGTLSPSIIQKNPDLPILGVCLGHQIMGHVYGAKVDLCGPVHGQVRPIEQQRADNLGATGTEGDLLWKNTPRRFNVTRYHSLAVTLPTAERGGALADDEVPLCATAYSAETQPEDRILMGMSHTENPHFGVQFHPESIGSEFGHQLLTNFCEICQSLSSSKDKHANGDSLISSHVDQVKPHAPQSHGHDRQASGIDGSTNPSAEPVASASINKPIKKKSRYEVFIHKVETTTSISPLQVFEEFLADEPYSVWLDTARAIQSNQCTEGSSEAAPQSYSSILGAGRYPIEYFGKEHDTMHQGLFRHDVDTANRIKLPNDDIFSFLQDEHENATDEVTLVAIQDDAVSLSTEPDNGQILPFDFRGGHVGYLGYEVRHDSERFLEELENGSRTKWMPSEDSLLSPLPKGKQESKERIPTAAFLFLDRSWVYDHSNDEWYLIGVVNQDESSGGDKERTESTMEWMRSCALRMNTLTEKLQRRREIEFYPSNTNGGCNGKGQDAAAWNDQRETLNHSSHNGESYIKTLPPPVRFSPNRSRSCYNQNFADCQEQIRLGESYELCLTNQLEAQVTVPAESSSPLELYKILRTRNPAPFSAFLNWNAESRAGSKSNRKDEPSSLAICCSSPERFVSVKRKRVEHSDQANGSSESKIELEVEAKPIKGTCARVLPQLPSIGLSPAEAAEDERRALELKASVKNQAENLMIVDLLRNDLSRVCEVGSVHVSKLMGIESYATVHQMVSTIRGRLNPTKANAVDVLKATFPGGSMTGAPKIRTMEILDRLEEGVSRGPYSGCLGYISMNGSMDMNIVIRSAVLQPKNSGSPLGAVLRTDTGDHHGDWKVSIGAGGAITALSESADEYEEMILKASAVIRAVEEWAGAKQGEAVSQLSE